MRNYSKVGGKPGKPAYRTPSSFKYKKSLQNTSLKNEKRKLEATIRISYNKSRKLDNKNK
ncbi:MAG TPA: hypothetical protein VK255_00270 [Patescibacteria group bacterium]|nr:hypothetical protein [Patescibacteria group bacterium]